jgi:hypothetical protein
MMMAVWPNTETERWRAAEQQIQAAAVPRHPLK